MTTKRLDAENETDLQRKIREAHTLEPGLSFPSCDADLSFSNALCEGFKASGLCRQDANARHMKHKGCACASLSPVVAHDEYFSRSLDFNANSTGTLYAENEPSDAAILRLITSGE